MEIYFVKSGYNKYGSGLDEPFKYLPRVVSERFLAENIGFPYQEIEIQLAYLSPTVKKEEYLKWYEKLPIYYRDKNMVRVILPVTEQVKSLANVFELFYKAFDIIISKKKKNDTFDEAKITPVLLQLEQELEAIDLWELHFSYIAILRQKCIDRNREERSIREQSFSENNRLIRDLRFYYRLDNIGLKYFTPYDHRLCDRILEKLREKKFRLPGYSHLYIMVSDTFENALYHSVRAENWFVYGIAV